MKAQTKMVYGCLGFYLNMIKSINKWSKKNLGRKQVLISRKDIFKVIPEEKLENI
jgi:hypothetical protein